MRSWRHIGGVTLVAALLCLAGATRVEAQLGALLSPGPLARAHASLEGGANCQKCHERGNRVTAVKCLTCHAPIAQRMARKVGVHRNVTTECVTCHADHAGVDGQLRPFDTARFNHAAETGFALAGKHAPLADKCASCHKARSFLTASPTCSSCHDDKHKGTLGPNCQRCHSVDVTFATATKSFDHSLAAFALTGAHKTVACASCHKTPDFKIAKFSTCTSCHQTPHGPKVSPVCTTCHTSENWKTKAFDHTRTAFPLVGKHLTADCTGCHKQPATKVKPAAATCATCHVDPHKGTFKVDCKACHTETGFAPATFNHAVATGYALTERHATVTCRGCHTNISPPKTPTARISLDYRGLKTTCASCHADPHATEFGTTCERCHSAKTFIVSSFTHVKSVQLFAGEHLKVTCDGCHTVAKARTPTAPANSLAAKTPGRALPRYTTTPTLCASCHLDPHLGQLSPDCATCHSLAAIKFAPDRFAHDRTRYPLTGKHKPLACARCHQPVTQEFPGGSGAAVKFTGVGTACASCHQDVHLGQVGASCETCHSPASFTVMNYKHRQPPRDFFVGRHASAECRACHAPATRDFPAGRGTTVNFGVGTACTACHKDPHNGTLGPDCARCHRPEPLIPAHSRPLRPRPLTRW